MTAPTIFVRPLLVAALLTLGVLPAAADTHPRCFQMIQMNGWRAPDGKTIYIRANANEYYRVDLASECSALKSINPHLVLTSHGSSLICSAIDLNVKAADTPGGIVEPCFPKTLTALSPAEAAALPKASKP
jgi:hypothetical protein